MDRRAFIATAALAPISATAGTAPIEDTPIKKLYDQWTDAYNSANIECGHTTLALISELEARVVSEPLQTMADLARKIIVTTSNSEFDFNDTHDPTASVWSEIRHLAGVEGLTGVVI